MGALKDLNILPIIHKYDTKVFVETGLGLSTGVMRIMQPEFGMRGIISIDIDKDLVDHAIKTFKFDSRILILNMHSVDGLKHILPQVRLEYPILAFLDAHFMASDYHLDDRKLNKHSDGDVSKRLPLWDELKTWKSIRIDRGAKDVIICDDIFLYSRDNHFDDNVERLGSGAVPDDQRDYLPKFIELFKETHIPKIIYEAQGTLMLLPK